MPRPKNGGHWRRREDLFGAKPEAARDSNKVAQINFVDWPATVFFASFPGVWQDKPGVPVNLTSVRSATLYL